MRSACNRVACVALLASGLGGLAASAEGGETRHSDHYVTKNEIAKLEKDGVTRLMIGGACQGRDYDNVRGRSDSVGYPAGPHIKSMNGAATLTFDLCVTSSAFPSPEQSRRINELSEKVDVALNLLQCLSTDSEKRRLLSLERPATVHISCNSNLDSDRARKIAAEVESERPHLRIDVQQW